MKSYKHLLTLFLTLSCLTSLLGQNTKKTLNYQAVILDPKAIDIPGASIVGQPLNKGNVCLRFSLLNAQGGLDYEETQQVTTDEYGLVSVAIGAGAQAQASNSTSIYKSFESIVWNASIKSLKVSVSYDGCSSFKQVSSQSFNYTPYALYAESVEYKNVRDAPTKLSQFANDAGYLIPKDLDPLKTDIKTNSSQIATANQTIQDNKQASDAAFLIVNQSITSLDIKVAENTTAIKENTSSIKTINTKLSDQQNQITANNNTMNAQIGGLQGQINTTNNTVSNLTGVAEMQSNKSTATDLGGSNPSDQAYPSQKATKTYVDLAIYDAVGSGVPDATTLAAGKVKLSGDLGGTAMNPTVPALANKENTANKSTATDLGAGSPSDQLYPSQKATKAYVDNAIYAAVGTGVPDATTNAAGKVKLAGDLAGTASSPTVPGLLLKADIASPTFTGTPTAPTPATSDNSTQIATTAFVQSKVNAATVNDATTSATGIVQLTGDLGGSATSPSVIKLRGTSISTVAPVTAGHVLTYDATGSGVAYWAAPQNSANTISGVVPVANGGTGLSSVTSGGAVYATSSSALATGTLPLTAGGTGETSQQAAINALTGSQSLGKYLRSDGTNASLSTIVASDVPTLNQNTTGNAATATSFTGNLTGDVTGTQSATVVNKINGTSLAGLSTGILKNTTSTGVPTIAIAGTDYQSPLIAGTDYQAPLTLTTTGTGAATLSGATLNIPTVASNVNATGILGTVAVANGGTNSTATPTSGGVGYGNGTAHAYTAAGTSGQVLISNGSSAPSWGAVTATSYSGTLPIANGGTGATTATAALGNLIGTQAKNTIFAGPSSSIVTLASYDGSSLSGFSLFSNGVSVDATVGNPGSSIKSVGGNNKAFYQNFGQNFKNKIIEFDIRITNSQGTSANATGGIAIGARSDGGAGIGLGIVAGTNNQNGLGTADTWGYPPRGPNTYTFNQNTWYSIKIISDNGTAGGVSWYVNGTLVGNSGSLTIGNDTYFGFTAGYDNTTVYFDNITIKDISGLPATPSFRALVADDISTVNASSISGTVAVANGGTNSTATPTSGGVGYGNGTAHAYTSAGTSGQVLISNGSSAPSWGAVTATSYSGTLPIANGGTNSTEAPTSGGVGYGTGTAHAYTSAGTSGQVLISNGSSAPTWGAITATSYSGTLPIANGGTGVTSATGSGSVVLSTSPTLVTPNLGTPSTLVGTNISGTAANLTAGNVTTNANLTGDVTSVGNATTLAASGVVSGTYGSSTAIPTFTVDSKGRLTSANTTSITAGVNTLTYTNASSYANGGTISGTTLTLAAADATNPGLISTGAQTIAGAKTFNGNLSAPTVTTPIYASTPQALTSGSTISWNPANGLNANVTLNQNSTLSFSSTPASGSYGTLVITQDATGGRTITLPSTANKVLGSTSTTTIALSTAAGAKDILNFYYDGTNCYWNIGQGYGTASTSSLANLATGVTGTLAVANGGTGVSTSTGSGSVVLSTSPTLVTPDLGTPSTLVGTNITGTASGLTAGNVTTNANLTGDVTSVGNATTIGSGKVTNSMLAGSIDLTSKVTGTMPVANGGTGVTTSTGSGSVVLSTSPILVTPNLGTPSTLVGTNISGTAANLTAGNVTTNANLTGDVTSVGNATTIGLGKVTNSMLAGSIDLTSKVTGILPVANGGTGATTLTGYVKGSGTSAMTASASIPVADVSGAAPLASPALTGTPTAPTATSGDNTTQIATTAFVTAAVAAGGGGGGTTYTTGLNSSLGGYVFYVTPDGKHGLVAETHEYQDSYYNAPNSLMNPSNHSTAGQNFLDWRLPQLYELNLMYNIKATLGMTTYEYWSGTSHTYAYGSTAFYKQFNNGVQYDVGKDQSKYIRAVRSF